MEDTTIRIAKTKQGEKVVLTIAGRIDTTTSPVFEKELEDIFAKGTKEIILDFKDVDYISSAGLRVILYAQKTINNICWGNMVVRNVNDTIMEIFNMTGFSDFLTIKNDDQ